MKKGKLATQGALAGVALVAFGFAGWQIYRSRRSVRETQEIGT